jgi:hypothetical protein
MSSNVRQKLGRLLDKIDRPGSFCASGSVPAFLPGLEVAGLGPVGLPLTAGQAKELKKLCEQAPYGKGTETVVDTSVRRVWRLKPERFTLTNPEWEQFLRQTLAKVQAELGLEEQKLEAHLYDLLLYEPGSFFLPHRDGEKLDRMVGTLVITLPSSFQGGELAVRHDGQEQVIDAGSEDSPYRIHFAAFYADCEHEVRPLREGYRLSLVYNLTLKKGKKGLSAPRTSEYVEPIARILREWAADDEAGKLGVTLDHQYTQEGLAWDALKGVDRVKAQVLREAAQQAGCQAYLALLTFHQSGSAEDAGDSWGGYRRRRRWDDEDEESEDAGGYEMGEIFDSSLEAEHFRDSQGRPLPISGMNVEEDELVDPEWYEAVDPEEEFEGYTGNEGMTLDRWYRRAAIFVWPSRRHFAILCDAGTDNASRALKQMVDQWQQSGPQDAALRANCVEFAAAIITRWVVNPYGYGFGGRAEPSPFPESLAVLDEPGLIKAYLREVMTSDTAADLDKSLLEVCQKHGWETFQPELEVVFRSTTTATMERNVRFLEEICLAKPRKKEEWMKLVATLARATVGALEGIDQEKAATEYDYHARSVERADVLAGLARSLLATEQSELLSRVVAHALARPAKYPLTAVHVAALTALQPWLEKNVKKPVPALSQWLGSCCEQLAALTARAPEPFPDWRRPATITCHCADCAELKRFLDDPREQVHRFAVAQARRGHLEHVIRHCHCDLDCRTEQRGRPYTLVCTKNSASYEAKLMTFHQDQEHLATLRSIQAGLPR